MADVQTAWVIWHPKPQAFLPNTMRAGRFDCIIRAMFKDSDDWMRLADEAIEAKWRDEYEAIGIRCVKVRLVEEEAGG